MAGNEGYNKHKFNLSFQNSWHHEELVREGRNRDPLFKKLRVITKSQYEDALLQKNRVPYTYDFVYDDEGIIMNGVSSGLSTFTSEGGLAQALGRVCDPRKVWRLRKMTEDESFEIMYPKEMELNPIEGSDVHFGIRPAKDEKVRHETFLQMLRCLPWTKLQMVPPGH
ncbi:PREDICTED: uncharacterized protein LOC107340795 isoform X1 [Acropora digitifera]|uniref:uncharacterized protein LOC107340795 isoform X1 n=1 Tax=Acropora digitifera TaxID=70779 RepID=UPI00077AB4E7|nr:PREDICTED: uncharacterized protein LOC107340795 isoform X1 [Acropora digitifera]